MSLSKSIAIVGHVDHGKSTLLGHLLLQTGQIEAREWEKICQEAEQRKMLPWKYAFILDIFDEERESGKTSEHCVVNFTYALVGTENVNYKFVDTPGHQHLVKEMITGVSKCSICMLIISAKNGEFESGWNGQTREHLFIARGMGIKHLVIVWNKMDTLAEPSGDWNLSLLQPMQKTVTSFLTSIGFSKFRECFVSGWTGENLVKQDKPSLPSLLGVLNKIDFEEKINTIPCTENATLMLCKILVLKDWNGILTPGWRGILHSGEWYSEVEINRLKNTTFAKGGDTVDVVLKCDNFLPPLLRKNVILRQQSGTIAMGQILDTK